MYDVRGRKALFSLIFLFLPNALNIHDIRNDVNIENYVQGPRDCAVCIVTFEVLVVFQ